MNACTDTPDTIVKWPSCVGLVKVEWHSLYAPAEASVTVTAPEAIAPPCVAIFCEAPEHERSPANRKTTLLPAARAAPLNVNVVARDAKAFAGVTRTFGGAGGGAGGGTGGAGDGGGGDGAGGRGGGGEGGGFTGDGGGGDGSGGCGMPACLACSATPETTEKWLSCVGLASVEWHILYVPTAAGVTVTVAEPEAGSTASRSTTILPMLLPRLVVSAQHVP